MIADYAIILEEDLLSLADFDKAVHAHKKIKNGLIVDVSRHKAENFVSLSVKVFKGNKKLAHEGTILPSKGCRKKDLVDSANQLIIRVLRDMEKYERKHEII